MVHRSTIILKRLVYGVSPGLGYFLGSLSLYNLRLRYEHLARCLIAQHGLVVQGGPFIGMAYIPQAVGSALIPKLLGCYEAELHGVIACALNTTYDTIIDIGCAEGYYAVGLALHFPDTPVYAFDTDPLAQHRCMDMAHTNGVADRVFVGGECDVERLRALAGKRMLVVCDCEGYEAYLLQPELAPALRTADILVELHDFIDRSISQIVLGRFVATHDIMLIDSDHRDPKDYPALSAFNTADQHIAVTEFRPEVMQWAFMTPKGT